MRLSTRNQLAGEIVSIARGEAMATIKVRLTGTEQVLTSAITADAANDLGLVEGGQVTLLIKATDVAIGIG